MLMCPLNSLPATYICHSSSSSSTQQQQYMHTQTSSRCACVRWHRSNHHVCKCTSVEMCLFCLAVDVVLCFSGHFGIFLFRFVCRERTSQMGTGKVQVYTYMLIHLSFPQLARRILLWHVAAWHTRGHGPRPDCRGIVLRICCARGLSPGVVSATHNLPLHTVLFLRRLSCFSSHTNEQPPYMANCSRKNNRGLLSSRWNVETSREQLQFKRHLIFGDKKKILRAERGGRVLSRILLYERVPASKSDLT